MKPEEAVQLVHLAGEAQSPVPAREAELTTIDTFGGRIHVEWDPQAPMTPPGWSALPGQKRYAHITTLRSDRVNPRLLGMKQVMSEDSINRGHSKSAGESHLAGD